MGAQHRLPTRKCDTRQAPASVLGGVELSRNLLLCFGGPCGPGLNHPADFGTTCLCPPRWSAFPVGPGRGSQLGQLQTEGLLESLGNSVQ